MSDSNTIQALQEQVRILESTIANQQAYITELQNRDPAVANQKARWFGYKNAAGTERGAFDLLMVTGWKATLNRRSGWQLTIYCGSVGHILEPHADPPFWSAFDKYLSGTT